MNLNLDSLTEKQKQVLKSMLKNGQIVYIAMRHSCGWKGNQYEWINGWKLRLTCPNCKEYLIKPDFIVENKYDLGS